MFDQKTDQDVIFTLIKLLNEQDEKSRRPKYRCSHCKQRLGMGVWLHIMGYTLECKGDTHEWIDTTRQDA